MAHIRHTSPPHSHFFPQYGKKCTSAASKLLRAAREELACEEYRPAAMPPLVVINGLAATSQDWDPTFIAGLSSRNELLLIENRGMGDAPDGNPFTIADLAGDVAAQLSEPTAVLGWSMGGFVAQQLALDHPELVKKLVLLSTDPGGRESGADPEILAQIVDLSLPLTSRHASCSRCCSTTSPRPGCTSNLASWWPPPELSWTRTC